MFPEDTLFKNVRPPYFGGSMEGWVGTFNAERVVAMLIYRKGDPNVPANFRPIKLEYVPLKLYKSLIRNRMFDFHLKNNFFEHNIQNA